MGGSARTGRRRVFLLLAALACLTIAVLLGQHFATRPVWERQLARDAAGDATTTPDERLTARIEAFCGDCHGLPQAETYPRDAWHDKVRRAYEYYARSGRNDLDPPPIYQTAKYFRARAPEQVVLPEPQEAAAPLAVTFATQQLSWEPQTAVGPGMAYLRWTNLESQGPPVLLTCDMRRGHVAAVDLRGAQPQPRILAHLDNPCHVEPCDLNGDGMIDLVVADLGSFLAGDHNQGKVVWLRRRKDRDDYEKVVLASGLGRVADVQAADLDGDGDLDLVVAEFGYYTTGKIAVLWNQYAAADPPRFDLQVIDPRPGAIHVPVHDLNGDGRPDILALISQEHECVTTFLNQGNGRFHLQTIWAGPDPTFGSTGIQLVDLDQDDDLDILLTNGDTFDDQYLKPSHGIQWLENLGGGEFRCRRLTDFPGVHCVRAGDIDLDGDLDLIAVSWLHDQLYPVNAASAPMTSIICLEQTSPGVFVRHTLETGFPCHAALELADFDHDGDLDFAVGWQLSPKWRSLPYWVTIWWNQRGASVK
jgi:hypothetical protein